MSWSLPALALCYASAKLRPALRRPASLNRCDGEPPATQSLPSIDLFQHEAEDILRRVLEPLFHIGVVKLARYIVSAYSSHLHLCMRSSIAGRGADNRLGHVRYYDATHRVASSHIQHLCRAFKELGHKNYSNFVRF
ncbi:hypothetical protein FRC12_005592 [Ceratobasidium sp. 428]|nr:hypothetical protein FRC12_005592 [Ceratobasidium sp. 428]